MVFMARRALIYGIFGQDGFYLSRLLLEKGYEVAGVARTGNAEGAKSGKTPYFTPRPLY